MTKKNLLLLFSFATIHLHFAGMQSPRKIEKIIPFTLISTNILDEELYQTLAKPPKSGMPWQKREKIFLQALADEKQLATADILCMQEFNSGTQANAIKLLQAHNYQGYYMPNITAPSIWFKTNMFSALDQTYYSFKTAGTQANGFAITILTPKNSKTPVIGIINAHLNNNTPATTTYDQFRLDQIQEIVAHVNDPEKQNYNWIICGDFNTDRRTHAHIMKPFTSKGFVDSQNHLLATAKSSQEKNPLKSIDYVWFKGNNLELVTTSVYPSSNTFEQMLLSHRPLDHEGTFFTDHAILKTQFKLQL